MRVKLIYPQHSDKDLVKAAAKARKQEWDAKRRADRRARNICTLCGTNPADKGGIMCRDCKTKNAERQRKYYWRCKCSPLE